MIDSLKQAKELIASSRKITILSGAGMSIEEHDLFLSLESSLRVYPASGFVEPGAQLGKSLIIINRDPTTFGYPATHTFAAHLGLLLPVLCA